MKGSQELIAFFNKREEELGEKASKLCMFLEGYAEGYRDTKAYMIDKACEYLRKEYQQMNAIINRLCVKDKGDLIKVEASVESFRKAMED